jgi:hypothetical protein
MGGQGERGRGSAREGERVRRARFHAVRVRRALSASSALNTCPPPLARRPAAACVQPHPHGRAVSLLALALQSR